MIPGVVAGCYGAADAAFDPAAQARAAGARWIRGRVTRIDAERREVELDGGSREAYDLLSLDIGSRPAGDGLPDVREHAHLVKPIGGTLRFRDAAERAVAAAPAAHPTRVVIVGAGAAGVEVAMCLDARLRAEHGPGRHRIVLLQREVEILPAYPERFRRLAARELERRRIGIRAGTVATRVAPDRVHVGDSDPQPYDVLLWATGPRAPELFRTSGLGTDDGGYLRVEPTLRSSGRDTIFAVGDCAAIRGFPWVPRAGVYAVREGPVLAGNLARALRGKPLRAYEPQRHWLSLMNSGDGRALLHWRGLAFHGRPAWWLKDAIDRRFMRRFRRLPE
jgi:selenide,water dikinase